MVAILCGGDLNENDKFTKGYIVMHGYTILHAGDLNENGKFQKEKLVMHGYKSVVWGRSSEK